MAVVADLAGGELALGPLNLTAHQLQVRMNSASGGAIPPKPLDWAHALRFGATTGAFEDTLVLKIDDADAGVEITRPELKGPLLKVAGSVTITFGDFLRVEGSFAFEKGADEFVTLKGATTTTKVTVLKIGISNARVFAGLGPPDSNGDDVWDGEDDAIGIVLNDVNLALALMSTAPPTAAPGTTPPPAPPVKKYMALKASGSAALVGIDGFELEGAINIELNSATDPAAAPGAVVPAIDFTKLAGGGLTVTTGPDPDEDGPEAAPSELLDFDGAVLRAAGSLLLKIESFVYVAGDFAFEVVSEPVMITLDNAKPAVGTTPAVPATTGKVTMLTVGASNVRAFVGVGGPYVVDSDSDGDVDQEDLTRNADGAMGLAITNFEFAMAMMKPVPATATAPNALTTKVSSLMALKARGSVELVGLPGITASLRNLSLEINQGKPPLTGPPPPANAVIPAVDFAASFPNGTGPAGLAVKTGPGVDQEILLDFDGGRFFAAGQITLQIDSFVSLSGTVAFEKGAPMTVTREDPDGAGSQVGQTDTVTALRIGADNVRVFVGMDGPYFADSDGDGDIDDDDTPQPGGAVGLVLEDVSFAMALLQSTTVATRKYFALKASAARIALVGVDGVTLEATELEVEINSASDSAAATGTVVRAIDFSKLTGGGLTVLTGPDPDGDGSQTAPSMKLDSKTTLLRASGRVELGVADVSIGANIFFEQAARPNGTKVIRIAVGDLDIDLGGFKLQTGDPTTPGMQEVNGAILLNGQGMAGRFTLSDISFDIGDATNGLTVNNIDLELTINTSPIAVNDSFAGITLVVPAGPYVRFGALDVDVEVRIAGTPVTLAGSFVFESVTLSGAKWTRIAASGVAISGFSAEPEDGGAPIVGASLTNGSGALLIKAPTVPGGTDGGVAGALRGDFAFSAGSSFDASATVILKFNSLPSPIDQTVVVDGQSIRVQVPGRSFLLAITNAKVSFGDFLTLSGDFVIDETQPGKIIYGARNVEIFLGEGPYRFEDDTINADAVGILITGATVGVVKFLNNAADPSDDRSAIYAFGTLKLLGLPGIGVSGSVRVLINQTGRVVAETIVIPGDGIDNNGNGAVDEANEPGEDDGVDNDTNGTIDENTEVSPRTIVMPFASAAAVVAVETGVNSFGLVQASNVLTFDFAGILKIQGAVRFTQSPTGRIEVDIPAAGISIGIPGDGDVQEILQLNGAARFSFGGGLGFVLQDFRVSGFEVLGQPIATIVQNLATARTPTADLGQPFAGQNASIDELNERGYIEIVYRPLNVAPGTFNPVGLNTGSITDTDQEFLLSGDAAADVVINGAAVQVPNDPYRWRYSFTGAFKDVSRPTLADGTTPNPAYNRTDPTNAVGIYFLPETFRDGLGASNLADSEQFNLFVPAPVSGFAALAVTAGPPPVAVAELASPFNGSTMTPQQFAARPYIDVTFLTNGLGTIDESTIDGDEIRLTGAVGNISLVSKNGLTGFIPGLPTKINATTWRYFLTPRTTGLPAATRRDDVPAGRDQRRVRRRRAGHEPGVVRPVVARQDPGRRRHSEQRRRRLRLAGPRPGHDHRRDVGDDGRRRGADPARPTVADGLHDRARGDDVQGGQARPDDRHRGAGGGARVRRLGARADAARARRAADGAAEQRHRREAHDAARDLRRHRRRHGAAAADLRRRDGRRDPRRDRRPRQVQPRRDVARGHRPRRARGARPGHQDHVRPELQAREVRRRAAEDRLGRLPVAARHPARRHRHDRAGAHRHDDDPRPRRLRQRLPHRQGDAHLQARRDAAADHAAARQRHAAADHAARADEHRSADQARLDPRVRRPARRRRRLRRALHR